MLTPDTSMIDGCTSHALDHIHRLGADETRSLVKRWLAPGFTDDIRMWLHTKWGYVHLGSPVLSLDKLTGTFRVAVYVRWFDDPECGAWGTVSIFIQED